MSIRIDSALGIHAEALALRARRAELLASNLANADTPGYKARDVDFQSALRQWQQGGGVPVATTNAGHIRDANPGRSLSEAPLYRTPTQPSLDGNTVDPHLEKAAFAENSVRYQTSLLLLDRKFRGLMTALRGE
jgi:flagellar basal-body rod protein FlgB